MGTAGPSYLSKREILELHKAAIARFGGKEGVVNEAALETCLAQPRTAVFGEERFPTLYDKGAAYCFYVCTSHPFHDGNKRTGLLAAIHFLLKNGVEPIFDDEAMYHVIMHTVEGDADVNDIAAVLRGIGPASRGT